MTSVTSHGPSPFRRLLQAIDTMFSLPVAEAAVKVVGNGRKMMTVIKQDLKTVGESQGVAYSRQILVELLPDGPVM